VLLVVFTIEIYYDARSFKRQTAYSHSVRLSFLNMSITTLNLYEDLWRSNVLGAIFRSGKTIYIKYKIKTCYYFIYIFTVTFLQSQDNCSIYNVCNLYN
jgi:hypothetical protein